MAVAHILVAGAGGQLGRSLREAAEALPAGTARIAFADRAELDITEPDTIADWLDRRPTHAVINAAAYTAVDRAASEPEAAWRANALAPGLLASACARRGVRLLHVSTDYVFDGSPPGRPWRESDAAQPLNTYGRSKLEGERRVMAEAPASIILRTGWVFSAHGHNFVKTILRLARERDSLQVIDDQRGGPTWAGHIAQALIALALRPQAPPGVYHCGGLPACSWHGFAHEILRQAVHAGLLARAPALQPIGAGAWPSPEPRPADSRLDSSRLAGVLPGLSLDWREGLARTLQGLQAEAGRT